MLSLMHAPRPEYPRPQFQRSDWLNLNGEWEFEIDPGNSGRERGLLGKSRLDGRIVVPFAPESRLSGVGHTDFLTSCWYRRTLNLPETWAERRLFLHFGAVDYEAEVWVNGQSVGRHRGGYTPFSFEITSCVKRGENSVVVSVFDDTRSQLQASGKQSPQYASHGCMYTRTTGIWQTVWIEPLAETFIASLRFHPDVDAGSVRIEVGLNGLSAGLRVGAEVRAGGASVGRASAPGAWHVVLNVPISERRLWSPADPFLYDLRLTLERDGRILDDVSSYFGLRTISREGHKILLNGKPLFMRLALDQGFYPDGVYTAPGDQALRRDVELAKELGFNGARLHMKLFEPRLLYWADRLGYILWGEFPNWGIDYNDAQAGMRYTAEWLEALARDFNHPSIIGWCPLNETWTSNSEAGFLLHENLYHLTKAADPARLCIDTSGYNHRVTDIYDVHDYDQNPASFAERYALLAKGETGEKVFYNKTILSNRVANVPFPGGPYFVSEYGGIWWDPESNSTAGWGYGGNDARPKSLEEYISRYRALTSALLRNSRICGFCFTQLYDVEQEVNGLLTYDRRHKFDPKVIRAINQAPAAIEGD